MQRKAEDLRTRSGQAYDAFRDRTASVAADEAGGLKGKITNDLANLDEPIYLDPHNHPIATKALGILDDLTGLRGAGSPPLLAGQNAQLSSISVQAVEKARRAILGLKPAPGSDDARVLGAVRRAFDQRLDDMVSSAGFRGDATAIDDLKQARDLWTQFSRLTKPRPGDPDDSRKLIADIIKQDRTGEEVANWLTNYASVGHAGKAARAAAQLRRISATSRRNGMSCARLWPSGCLIRRRAGRRPGARQFDRQVSQDRRTAGAAIVFPGRTGPDAPSVECAEDHGRRSESEKPVQVGLRGRAAGAFARSRGAGRRGARRRWRCGGELLHRRSEIRPDRCAAGRLDRGRQGDQRPVDGAAHQGGDAGSAIGSGANHGSGGAVDGPEPRPWRSAGLLPTC